LYVGQNALAAATLPQGLSQLTHLDLSNNAISVIVLPPDMTAVTYLNLSNNGIVALAPLTQLTKLSRLAIDNNAILEVSPLANAGLPLAGLSIKGNPLSCDEQKTYLLALKGRGVTISSDCSL
jgi:Leucine-rich repeat (LRR) protein